MRKGTRRAAGLFFCLALGSVVPVAGWAQDANGVTAGEAVGQTGGTPEAADSTSRTAGAPAAPVLPLYPVAAAGGVLLLAGLAGWLVLVRGRTLRRRLARYQSVFERVAEPMAILDEDLRVVEANAALLRLLDLTPKRTAQRSLLELIRTDEAVTVDALHKTIAQKGAVSVDAVAVREDRVVRVEVRVGRVNTDEPARYAAVLHDVSLRSEQFQRYEAFLERLLDGLPVEIALLSPEGRYQYLNPVALDDANTREWLIGKTDFEYCDEFGLHMEVALRRRSYRRQALETRAAVVFEEILPGGYGEERHVMRTYSPHLNPEGDVTVVAAFGVDLTELRRIQTDLQGARAETEKMMRFKETFLQNVGHELRTPITGIVGFTQILREEVPEPLQEFIQNIEHNARRLMDTLNAMLDLAGLRAENLTLNPRLVNLSDALQEAARPLQRVAEEKGLFLTVKAMRPEVLVRLDPPCLHRVLHNLIENAVKFTQQGGILVEVSVLDREAFVRVMDSGVGIGRSFLAEVFDEFRQEEPSVDRSFEGLGLGLAVTRRLIELMGGRISVQSDKGQGTMFSIAFPLALPEEMPFEGDRPRVLLVDRNAESHRVVERMLGARFRLTKAMSLHDGLEQAGLAPHDVVLLEVTAEEARNGAALVETLRGMPGYEHVPIIAIDAQRLPGNQHHFRRAGFDDHLSRPFDKLELLNTLVGILSQRTATLTPVSS